MTKVDILLTFWGDVALFKKTVASVLAQTNPDWRLFIFDDHYPSDEQVKYIESLNDPRIIYHRHEKNIGITANFNYALSAATSPFSILLGCDDILLPNYLDIALTDIKDADFYQPKVEVINQDGLVYSPLADRIKKILTPKPGVYSGEYLAASLCHGNWLYFPSILWRTDSIQKYKFNEKYKIVEDLFLEFQMIIDGATLAVGSTPTFRYRRFSQSLSSKEKKKGGIRFNEEDEVYSIFSKEFKKIGWKKAARAAQIRMTSRLHKLSSQ